VVTKAKVIAVTGASRGIGAAIAVELAHRGCTVACLTRKGKGPEVQGAKALAGKFVDVACDVTDEASLKAAFAAVVEQAGALDGLVNNAGIHLDGASHELPTATYEKVMMTNATAVYTACREAYPHLVKSGGGCIVNIGSFFDKIGVKRNLAYCASKAAVGAMTRCLAVEWAGRGIRVLDVAPGYIETDLNRGAFAGPLRDYLAKRIPSGKHGTEADVARLVAAIFTEDIAFLTGETIYVDGGQGIAH
jgi:NAD(P)-dependent dehydrogenase (short-subunit alcohol dehydrogenase family)